MVKLFFICWICLFINTDIPAIHFQGTYSYSYDNGKRSYASSGFLEVHYIDKDNILFYLEVQRATDYNSGALYGKLTLNTESGRYEYIPKDISNSCKLEFIRVKNNVAIKTVAGNCPFGYGVYADGTYHLEDKNNPQFFEGRSGQKIYFDKVSPENYSE